MLKFSLWRSALVSGFSGLLLAGLTLTACGSAATPTAEVATSTPAVEALPPTPTPAPAAAATATTVKPSITQPITPTIKPGCDPVDPKTDPLAGVFKFVDKYINEAKPNAAIAAVSAKDWSKGPANASVTLIEYADFQCPGCAGISPVVEGLKAALGDDMRLVYRHFPLITIHDKAQLTAEAAEAAGAQGKFWEMHDLLFAKQQEWSAKTIAELPDMLAGYAKDVGVKDVEKFKKELKDGVYTAKIKADYDAATKAELPGTPSFFFNQMTFPSEQLGLSYEALSLFTKMIVLKKQQGWQWYDKPEQVLDANKQYNATIKTAKGDIVLELYPDTAPFNVNSFAFLAQKGFYKGTTFHRVLPEFVAQGGDPIGLGFGFPGYRCTDEVSPQRTFDAPGMVALANSGPNTNGSQFFITYKTTPELNQGFTIIGKVVKGQEIAVSLTPRDPQSDPLAPAGDEILDVIIAEKP